MDTTVKISILTLALAHLNPLPHKATSTANLFRTLPQLACALQKYVFLFTQMAAG